MADPDTVERVARAICAAGEAADCRECIAPNCVCKDRVWLLAEAAIAALPSAAEMRERAALAIDAERLEDNTGDPADTAYNLALEHAAESVRALPLDPARGRG
jgi:hypothetical protein